MNSFLNYLRLFLTPLQSLFTLRVSIAFGQIYPFICLFHPEPLGFYALASRRVLIYFLSDEYIFILWLLFMLLQFHWCIGQTRHLSSDPILTILVNSNMQLSHSQWMSEWQTFYFEDNVIIQKGWLNASKSAPTHIVMRLLILRLYSICSIISSSCCLNCFLISFL